MRERDVMGQCPIRFLAVCPQSIELEEQAPSNSLEFLGSFCLVWVSSPFSSKTRLILHLFSCSPSSCSTYWWEGWSPEWMMFVLMTLCCGRAWRSPRCDPCQGTLLCCEDGCAEGQSFSWSHSFTAFDVKWICLGGCSKQWVRWCSL